MQLKPRQTPRRRGDGFTIVEAVVAMGIIGVLGVALYAGMASAMFSVRLARENLRATEIMTEKMEALRLFTWDQLLDGDYLPTNFTAYYYEPGSGSKSTNSTATGMSSAWSSMSGLTGASTNVTDKGVTYTGAIQLARFASADRNYSNDLRVVTITMNWSSGNTPRSRTLSTYIGKYGIQNYVVQ